MFVCVWKGGGGWEGADHMISEKQKPVPGEKRRRNGGRRRMHRGREREREERDGGGFWGCCMAS